MADASVAYQALMRIIAISPEQQQQRGRRAFGADVEDVPPEERIVRKATLKARDERIAVLEAENKKLREEHQSKRAKIVQIVETAAGVGDEENKGKPGVMLELFVLRRAQRRRRAESGSAGGGRRGGSAAARRAVTRRPPCRPSSALSSRCTSTGGRRSDLESAWRATGRSRSAEERLHDRRHDCIVAIVDGYYVIEEDGTQAYHPLKGVQSCYALLPLMLFGGSDSEENLRPRIKPLADMVEYLNENPLTLIPVPRVLLGFDLCPHCDLSTDAAAPNSMLPVAAVEVRLDDALHGIKSWVAGFFVYFFLALACEISANTAKKILEDPEAPDTSSASASATVRRAGARRRGHARDWQLRQIIYQYERNMKPDEEARQQVIEAVAELQA
eukprot:tig00000249_g22158.t1